MITLIQKIFLTYIRLLAKFQLIKSPSLIIGITGSEGKTSTKEAIKLILQQKYKVRSSDKANSETGIPLEILGIKVEDYSYKSWLKIAILAPLKLLTNWERYDIYLVEMAIDSINEPKNMSYLLKIIQPDIAIITSISAVHGANYLSGLTEEDLKLSEEEKKEKVLQLIANEKGKIITENRRLNTAILNIDNPYLETLSTNTAKPLLKISKSHEKDPDILINKISSDKEGFKAEYQINGNEEKIHINGVILGDEFAYTFGFALAVALALKIPTQHAIHELQKYKPEAGRFSIFEGIKNTTILDSSYNASPNSVRFALNKLDQIGKEEGRVRIAALGEMRELGEVARYEHEELAHFVNGKVDKLYLVGKNMEEHFLPELIKNGFPKENVKWFKDSITLGKTLKEELRGSEVILFKGSQNTVFLEEALKFILQDQKDLYSLCRQSEWWMAEKEKWFSSIK